MNHVHAGCINVASFLAVPGACMLQDENKVRGERTSRTVTDKRFGHMQTEEV